MGFENGIAVLFIVYVPPCTVAFLLNTFWFRNLLAQATLRACFTLFPGLLFNRLLA